MRSGSSCSSTWSKNDCDLFLFQAKVLFAGSAPVRDATKNQREQAMSPDQQEPEAQRRSLDHTVPCPCTLYFPVFSISLSSKITHFKSGDLIRVPACQGFKLCCKRPQDHSPAKARIIFQPLNSILPRFDLSLHATGHVVASIKAIESRRNMNHSMYPFPLTCETALHRLEFLQFQSGHLNCRQAFPVFCDALINQIAVWAIKTQNY
jgi:hypothetical protein